MDLSSETEYASLSVLTEKGKGPMACGLVEGLWSGLIIIITREATDELAVPIDFPCGCWGRKNNPIYIC